MKPRVFLTGASGFIGGYVLQEFVDNGWEVHALVHRSVSPRLEELRAAGTVTLHSGDCASQESLGRVFESCGDRPFEAIVHCAGRASDIGRDKDFRRANYESVQHLARLTLDTGAQRLVFVSSTDVYGIHDFKGEAEDELPLEGRPANPYPKYKIKAEQWLAKAMPPERYALVRPAAVWGNGDLSITQRVVDFLRVSPFIVHFGKWKGRNRWPLAHVRNVAAAVYLLASGHGRAGQPVNVADSEMTTIDGFYRMVAGSFFPNKKYRTMTIPFWLAWPFARAISFFSNLFGLRQPFMDPSYYALISISRNLDFSNQRFLDLMRSAGREVVTLEQGLDELHAG